MEQYVMGSENQVSSISVVQGKYYEKIHKKHEKQHYGGIANV